MNFEGATCRETDPELWFPPFPNGNRGRAVVARQLCQGCVVLESCQADVYIGNTVEDGIKAGMGPKEQLAYSRPAA